MPRRRRQKLEMADLLPRIEPSLQQEAAGHSTTTRGSSETVERASPEMHRLDAFSDASAPPPSSCIHQSIKHLCPSVQHGSGSGAIEQCDATAWAFSKSLYAVAPDPSLDLLANTAEAVRPSLEFNDVTPPPLYHANSDDLSLAASSYHHFPVDEENCPDESCERSSIFSSETVRLCTFDERILANCGSQIGSITVDTHLIGPSLAC